MLRLGAALAYYAVFSLALLIIVVIAITALVLEQQDVNDLLNPAHFVISSGVGALLFAMIFKYVPDVRIAWRAVWISAAVTTRLSARTIGCVVAWKSLEKSWDCPCHN